MTILYLVRHGQIDANVDKRWFGTTDSPLNRVGEEQAMLMGEYLSQHDDNISAIYASPLQRTFQTASALAGSAEIEVQTDPRLVEFGIGDYEGHPYEDLHELGFFKNIADDQDFSLAGGESVNQVAERVSAAITDITHRHTQDTVALVGHGAALAIAMAALLDGCCYPFYQYHMGNTGISRLVIEGSHIELQYFDEQVHLNVDKKLSASDPGNH